MNATQNYNKQIQSQIRENLKEQLEETSAEWFEKETRKSRTELIEWLNKH